MIDCLYDKFKEWSNGGSIWLISDTHFDDLDCKLMDDNWPAPEDYIKNINKKVYKNDTLICLGDCGNLEYFSKIKAKRKILIKGNHDDKGNDYYKDFFSEVYCGPLFISDKILLSHEPLLNDCYLNIHGHEHNTAPLKEKELNIAANIVNYEPINLKNIIKEGKIAFPNIHRLTINKATEKRLAYV